MGASWPLPDVDAHRCVHHYSADASCRECVQACPRQAWILDDDSLGLDTELCDGCALCVPACPEAAIVGEVRPWTGEHKGRRLAVAVCDQGANDLDTGLIPCLHAIGLRDLAKLYGQDIHRIVVAEAPCDDCPREVAARLTDSVANFNRLLASRRIRPIELETLDIDAFTGLSRRVDRGQNQVDQSRRGFLMFARQMGREPPPADAGTGSPAARLPSPAGAIMPFAPRLDSDLCRGCDACVRLCPQGALQLVDDGSEAVAYGIEPRRCTGCGLCEDVCDDDAVRVDRFAVATSTEIPLTTAKCRACGCSYHWPSSQPGDDDYCRVCIDLNHYRRLHQVVD
ncbi:MAG: 4Fe-4S dicluster domain-containing protein [Hyphomicrobiales bacterium]|nr:4Fe-4S dicluster domain-containing protein [Hyphomicrobiales bacterium]